MISNEQCFPKRLNRCGINLTSQNQLVGVEILWILLWGCRNIGLCKVKLALAVVAVGVPGT